MSTLADLQDVLEDRPFASVLARLRDELAELEWQEQALCAQTDPESFFPEKGGSTKEAKATCRRGLRDAPVTLADDDGRLPCEHCGRTFAYAARLREHIDHQHQEATG